jgi:GGDEF domain-containing protein
VVGDELLQAVAARLKGVVRQADGLGRLGGDEFVVIAEDLSLAAGPSWLPNGCSRRSSSRSTSESTARRA